MIKVQVHGSYLAFFIKNDLVYFWSSKSRAHSDNRKTEREALMTLKEYVKSN